MEKLGALRRVLARPSLPGATLTDDGATIAETPSSQLDLGPAYRIVSLLGTGGMGAVWLARWTRDDVTLEVAVKVLLGGRESHIAVQRFQRERRILARLSHPGIARLLDVGSTSDGRMFLTMEYIDGQPLMSHVQRTRPGIRERLRLLIEICDAVEFAHRHFVVHRDLKPLNVLVDAQGRPHLLDFGIARLFGDSEEETLTATGIRPLSPGYAAPEQLRGDDVGTSADIYALGVIGYELLCGSRPFDRQGGLEKILRDLGTERLRAPSAQVITTLGDESLLPPLQRRKLARELQGDLDTIILRALAARPERRYPTAAELGNDLQRYLDGEPIRARPDSSWYRMHKFAARHRTAVAIAASAVIALIIGLLVALAQARRANFERDRALAARDFLLGMVQSANPYQAPNPSLRIDLMLENAASSLVGQFPDDPEMEAQLLQQFGRSLMILERTPAAADALERAQKLLAGRVPDTHPVLLETRGRLTDLYRLRREFARARALAESQFALCASAEAPTARQCLIIRNDRIEASLFAGDSAAALAQIEEARTFATSAQLDRDYESVFVDYLAGMARRQLGQGDAAAEAFLQLAERTLDTVPAQHPGLLTDMLWFGYTALDQGDLPLAEACAEYALKGRSTLYATSSRYVQEVRVLRGMVAMAQQDDTRALAEFAAVLAPSPAFDRASSTQRALARAWLDVLAVTAPDVGVNVTHATLELDLDRDDKSFRATEMRLAAALGALMRGEFDSARAWRAAAEDSGGIASTPYWLPLAHLIDVRLLQSDPGPATDTSTDVARRLADIDALLVRQQRRLRDPTTRGWLGPIPPSQAKTSQHIRALATRIGEVRGQPF